MSAPQVTPSEGVASLADLNADIEQVYDLAAAAQAEIDGITLPLQLVSPAPVRDTGTKNRAIVQDQAGVVVASFGQFGQYVARGFDLMSPPARDHGAARALVTVGDKSVVSVGGDGALIFKTSDRALTYVAPPDAIANIGGFHARFDGEGYVYSATDFDGYTFDVRMISASAAPTGVVEAAGDVAIAVFFGQSNAGAAVAGIEFSEPIYPHSVLRFDYPNPALSSGTTTFDITDIVPADDTVTNSATVGHFPATMAGVAMEWAARRLGRRVSPGIATLTSLQGGSPINDFVPGQNTYENIKTGVEIWQDLMAGYGRSVTVPAIHYVQGETLGTDYAANLTLIADTLPGEVQTITGQASAPLFAVMQTQNAAAVSAAALLQVEVARAEANVVISAPLYAMPLKFGDNIHLDPIGRLMQGEIAAYVNDTVVAGETWTPVWWTDITYNGAAQIDLTYAVPAGLALSIDDDWVPDTPNHGFHLFAASNGVAISSVTLTGANTVRITLDGTPTGTPRLGYARGTGAANVYVDGSYTRADPNDPTRTITRTFEEGYMSWRGNLMVETARPSAFYGLGKIVPPYVRLYAVADEWTLATGTFEI